MAEKYVSPALIITAKREGFRRAGLAHSEKATEHAAGRFTEAQVEQLTSDPMLVVQIQAGK